MRFQDPPSFLFKMRLDFVVTVGVLAVRAVVQAGFRHGQKSIRGLLPYL